MADDDYAPALEMDGASAREASDVTHHERVDTAAAPPPAPKPVGDDPNSPPQVPVAEPASRAKARAMFRDLSAKVMKGELSIDTGSDLVPVEHDAPAAAPPPKHTAPVPAAPVPPTASPAAQAAAAIAPPVAPTRQVPPPQPPPHDVGKAEAEQRKLLLDMRQKDLEAREAALVAKEKQLPSREKLLDRPVQTLAEYIRDVYGITDDNELKDTITDLMTEMSEQYHGVKLPDEIKTRVDSRKALRSVKAYKAGLDRERAELQAKAEAQSKADADARDKAEAVEHEKRAVAQLTGLLDAQQAQFPYLVVQDNHAAIVWEVLKERHNRGLTTNWADAAKYANDYYQAEHERSQTESAKRAARLQTLLAPAATAAPAPAVASPGGAPGPAPTPHAPAVPAPQPPAEPQILTGDPSEIIGEDRKEARARSLRKLIAKHGLGANSA